MIAIGKALGVAVAIVVGTVGGALAEFTPVAQFGGWRLLKDVDPLFGDLGYRLTLDSTSDQGASTLSLLCYFDEKNTISQSIQLSSTLVDFGALPSSGGKISSLLRYDEEGIREADWLAAEEPGRLGFSSGGNNFTADYRNPAFQQAVRDAHAGKGGGLARLLTTDMLASGIEMFFWNMTVHRELALGFGAGANRRSILFDLGSGGEAIERLLGDCYRDAAGSAPKDTRSPREVARWGLLAMTRGEFKWISLDPGQCLELHAVRHRRGDPLTVKDVDNPGTFLRTTAGGDDLLLEGPKQRLEVYFGEKYTEGEVNYRTWDRQAATCAED